jgi:hypothetical protein
MEDLIATLVNDYDAGRMNRRQLIQGLAVAAAAAFAPGTAAAQPAAGNGFNTLSLDHI